MKNLQKVYKEYYPNTAQKILKNYPKNTLKIRPTIPTKTQKILLKIAKQKPKTLSTVTGSQFAYVNCPARYTHTVHIVTRFCSLIKIWASRRMHKNDLKM